MVKIHFFISVLSCAVIALLSASTFAEPRCQNSAATLESAEGSVEWQSAADDDWLIAQPGFIFCYGDRVRILTQRAALRLANNTLVRLQENSLITLLPEEKGFWVELIEGAGHFLSRTPKQFTIKAPYLNAAVDGTEFVVSSQQENNRVAVLEGNVWVSNEFGEIRLSDGMETHASATTAPNPAQTIRLRDAAEWILYYPPLLAINPTSAVLDDLIVNERYSDALAALAQDTLTAESATLAASLALNSGQPQKADQFLQLALEQNPQLADALALRALRTLIAGDSESAITQTIQLIKAHPKNPSALLVHAYALQSQGEIEKALQVNEQALELTPDNLFALARTAELHVSADSTRAARKLIDRALQKAPRHSRINTLAGFIALNRFATKDAQKYFQTAIDTNDSEPLSRLGLALTLIQRGNVDEGRKQMEMAVLLDPSSSLLRSYLGKTYAAQNQNDWADTQYQLAKSLDPNDPTPWFYRGLQQQRLGNLVAALKEFNQSSALNENRAVYRSRLYLDRDSASRAAGTGFVYNNLGLSQQAIYLGAKAIQTSSTEHNGHRLLAESYAEDNRYESIKVSERLQATMLQPIGTPSLPFALSQPGLLISDGATPADLGINEYGRLFGKDGIHGKIAAALGGQNTRAYDVNFSGMSRKFSFDANQYQYETDGFRTNNQINYKLSSGLIRWQSTETFNIYAEAGERTEEKGDLALRFDLDDYDSDLRTNIKSETYRLGISANAGTHGRILGTLSSTDQSLHILNGYKASTAEFKDISSSEIAYITQYKHLQLIIGKYSSNLRVHSHDLSAGESPTPENEDYNELQNFDEYYLYTTANFEKASITLGADFFKDRFLIRIFDDTSDKKGEWETLEKIGFSLRPADRVEINLSKYKSFSRLMELQTTLKPTHIQIFPQIFDGASNGTLYDNLSSALTLTPTDDLTLGIIHSDRKLLEQTLTAVGTLAHEPKKESHVHSFITWHANRRTTITMQTIKESYSRYFDPEIPNIFFPVEVATTRNNLQLHYNHQNKLWSASVNQITQDYTSETFSASEHSMHTRTEDFLLLDLSFRYFFSKGRGSILMKISNAFDRNFRYADYNVYTLEQRSPKFLPERSFIINLSANIN